METELLKTELEIEMRTQPVVTLPINVLLAFIPRHSEKLSPLQVFWSLALLASFPGFCLPISTI